MKIDMQKKQFLLYTVCIIFLLLILLFSFHTRKKESESKPLLTDTQIALDTVITISLYDSSDQDILADAFKLCRSYETVFSRTNEASELYKLNHSNSVHFKASDDLASLIDIGLKYSKISGGAFDISIAPVSSLWNFKSDSPKVPDDKVIQAALPEIGYQNILVDGKSIIRTDVGEQIDLGAIAKGYIADRIKDFLLEKGVNSAVINLGGNILLVGDKPDGSDFNIGIQAPFKDREKTIASIKISDKSIVTSGIYERYFTENGKLYHHILNPETGYPYDNDLMSVTIISEKSVDGDALSTTCFAMGLEKGMKYIESKDGLDGIFITKNGKKHYSSGIFESYDITEAEE